MQGGHRGNQPPRRNTKKTAAGCAAALPPCRLAALPALLRSLAAADLRARLARERRVGAELGGVLRAHERVLKVGAAEVGALPRRAREHRVDELGAREVGVGEVDAVDDGVGQVGALELGLWRETTAGEGGGEGEGGRVSLCVRA